MGLRLTLGFTLYCGITGKRNLYRRQLKALIKARPERREGALRSACRELGVRIERGEWGFGGVDEGYSSAAEEKEEEDGDSDEVEEEERFC